MPKNDDIVELKRLERRRIEVWVIGSAPLIMHKWSEKALRSMPGHPDAGVERMAKKGVRKPVEEATSCVYRLAEDEPIASGNIGFPATGFKAAIIGACRLFDKPSMTEAKQLLYVEGEGLEQLVRIYYRGEPKLREDVPRISNTATDLRYRYQFFPWWARLTVHFIPTSISQDSVVTLVDAAGFGGVGEWRPTSPKSMTGTYGTFRVMLDEERKEYLAEE